MDRGTRSVVYKESGNVVYHLKKEIVNMTLFQKYLHLQIWQ